MKIFLALTLLAALAGCENGKFAPTEADRVAEKARVAKRGEARRVMFKECMELAAKMPRQADDDVADIVSQCSSQAFYMTNYIE